MTSVKISFVFFWHATVCKKFQNSSYSNNRDMVDLWWKFMIRRSLMTSWTLLFSTFYADIKRNFNSRILSRNIHFEVKYLENGMANNSDTYIIL